METAVDLTGSFLVQKGKESEITSNVTLSENVEAPVEPGAGARQADLYARGRNPR